MRATAETVRMAEWRAKKAHEAYIDELALYRVPRVEWDQLSHFAREGWERFLIAAYKKNSTVQSTTAAYMTVFDTVFARYGKEPPEWDKLPEIRRSAFEAAFRVACPLMRVVTDGE